MLVYIFIYIFFSWVCDDEPDCGSSPEGTTLDISDEDPVRCRGNVSCSGNQFLCKVSKSRVLYGIGVGSVAKIIRNSTEFYQKIIRLLHKF